ncbi:MAG: hypothetical protein HUJ72_01430 [Blautia sp.]|nr:hypothetical protein [Blautia sp.]
MSDLYTEFMVKKESTPKDAVVKYGLYVLTGLAAAAGVLVTPLAFIAAIGLGIACYFVVPGTDLEFEYLYVNGEMDIDKIMSKTKRKRAFSFSLEDADVIAPLNSHKFDYYNNNQNLKVVDFSSGNNEHKRYAVITREKETLYKVIIEPDANLVNLMKKSAPSKVFLDA